MFHSSSVSAMGKIERKQYELLGAYHLCMAPVDVDIILRIIVSGVEIPSAVLAFYCMHKLVPRARAKRDKFVIYLMYVFLFLGLAPAVQQFDAVLQPYVYTIKYGYVGVIICMTGFGITLLLFASEIFAIEATQIPLGIRLFRILFITSISITGAISAILKFQDQDVTIYLGEFMFISLFLFVSLYVWAVRLSRRVSDPVYHEAIASIGYFVVSFIVAYVLFVADSFYEGYSLWAFFGWSAFFCGVIFAYRGFILPSKFMTRTQ